MSTRYWFVRHGPTHAAGFTGHRDIPADLSDTAALKRLSGYLPPKAKLFSSDLCRARDTATAIRSSQKLLPDNPQFRELDFGDWDGKTFSEVDKANPSLAREFWENPGSIAPPNGESWDQLTSRISKALAELHSGGPQGDIIIVAHFAVILAALQLASGMPSKAVFSFKIDNLSVTQLDYLHDSNKWRVMGVNAVV